jgi:glycosyltransferase involved in cell wall biosynthesis
MHIAYIHQYFTTRKQRGGTRSYEMARRLVESGHRVSMVAGTSETIGVGGRTGEVIREDVDGIEVHRIIEPYSNAMGFARRWRAFLRFSRRAVRLIGKLDDVDLVFATSTPLPVGPAGRRAAKRCGCPLVFEVRDLWPELPIAMGLVKWAPLRWYMRRMEVTTYRAAERVVALAPGIADGVAETGYPRERIAVIPNCSDVDLFQPAEGNAEVDADERFGRPGEFRLAFTGAHGLANGLDAVLDAAAVLKGRGVQGVRFCFIGGGGKKPALVERARREGLEGLVSWVDPIPKLELARVLPQMDVGMMILKNVPAFYRGTSPNKFFDYVACGLPVLNNYPGWLADYIRDNECGVVVPPDDPEAFADAVLWLRDHRDALPAMGRRARKLAETEFSRDRLAGEFVKVLEAAAQSR